MLRLQNDQRETLYISWSSSEEGVIRTYERSVNLSDNLPPEALLGVFHELLEVAGYDMTGLTVGFVEAADEG